MSAAEKIVSLDVVRQAKAQAQERPRMQDGFIAIPNAVFDAAFAADLTPTERDMLFSICRKTYGFGKQVDDVTISQLADYAKIKRQNASPAFNALLARNIITAGKGTHGFMVSINHPDSWKMEPTEGQRRKATPKAKAPSEIQTTECISDMRPSEIQTHNIQPQKTTTPPVVPQGETPPQPAAKPKRERKPVVTMKTWMEMIKASGEQSIPADDPIFADAEKIGLPRDYLRICWLEFRDRHCDGDRNRKRYADWRAAFRNAVRDNWFRLWAINADGECFLTTQGTLAMRRFKGDEE